MIPWQTLHEIARLKEDAELSEFGWENDDFKVKLSSTPAAAPATAPAQTEPESGSVQGKRPSAESAPDEDWVAIEAPMVGTFYEAPAPDAEPFVAPGDSVSYTTTVCIIEAMKLMNEIEAESKGEIKEVCKDDGDAVSKGDTLFYVDPA